MANTEDFVQWAMAPERTLEERCAIEKAVEWGVMIDHAQRNVPEQYNWQEKREIHNARRLNPAYEPALNADMVRSGEAGLRLRKEHSTLSYQDRPMRDLGWLRFFPHLEELRLDELEVADYSPLASLPNLRRLSIQDDQTIDLRALGRCAALEKLTVRVRQPWVKVDGLERLERLHTVRWHGSPLVLQAIPKWPAVRHAVFQEFCLNFPLRDAFQLPEMPLLEVLDLESIFSLEGIERYPRLINLKVAGPFRDVQPLAECRALTHLSLQLSIHLDLDVLKDVSPLARLPELRSLHVRSHRPRDYSSLVEAPHLHEVSLVTPLNEPLQACAMEQATLNATLESWDAEFLRPAPRPLPPLQIGYVDTKLNQRFPEPPPAGEPPPAWEENPGFRESEGHWLKKRLAARLRQLLDHDEHWGDVSFTFSAASSLRHLGVSIASQEAALRLCEIIGAIREEFAWTHCPWSASLDVSLELPPVNDPRAMAEIERQSNLEDEGEWKRRLKEESEFLERKHRLDLQKESGAKIRPEDFAAPGTKVPSKAKEHEEDDENLDEEVDEDEDDDLAELDDEDGDLDFDSERPHPEADRYFMGGTVHEGGVFISKHFEQTARHLLSGNPPT